MEESLKKNKLVIMLVVIATLIVIDVTVRVWFKLQLNYYTPALLAVSTIGNNILTPIAAIVSVWMFWKITSKQNSIIESQNLKENFGKEFYDIVKAEMEKDVSSMFIFAMGVFNAGDFERFKDIQGLNSTNYIKKVEESLNRLRNNEQFQKDFNKNDKKINYYLESSYSFDLRFILSVFRHPLIKYSVVIDYLYRLNNSNMRDADKRFFKDKARITWIDEYNLFIQLESNFKVPNIYSGEPKIEWISLSDLGIDRYLKDFVTELK